MADIPRSSTRTVEWCGHPDCTPHYGQRFFLGTDMPIERLFCPGAPTEPRRET